MNNEKYDYKGTKETAKLFLMNFSKQIEHSLVSLHISLS